VRNAGLEARLGRERMLFNTREAITRYQAMQATAGGTPNPVLPGYAEMTYRV
jgi:hypothetical protein